MENDRNENNNRRLRWQDKLVFIRILKIFGIILIISLITPFIEMGLKGSREIFLALFMAQIFTSIISIGLIILLIVIIKETKYGMPISRYITEVKPGIFKPHYIIILSLVINAVNSACVILNCYKLSYILFFISLSLLLLMFNILIDLFISKNQISEDIGNYIIENYIQEESLLENFQKEILYAIEIQNSMIYKENTDLLTKLFEKEIENNGVEGKEKLEAIAREAYNRAFLEDNEAIIITSINNMYEIYKTVNHFASEDKPPVPLNIWDRLSYYKYRMAGQLDIKQLFVESKLFSLHYELYRNLSFAEINGEIKPLNCFDLEYWASQIYDYLMKNKSTHFIELNQTEIKKMIFDEIFKLTKNDDFEYFNPEKKEIAARELAWYTRGLINNLEWAILADCFFTDEKMLDPDQEKNVIIIIIYLCFLGYWAVLDDNEELYNLKLQDFARKLLRSYHMPILKFLESYFSGFEKDNQEKYFQLENQLLKWGSITKNNSVENCLIIGRVFTDFIVWHNENEPEELMDKYSRLKCVTEG